MKVLYLLLLIALCEGLPLNEFPRNLDVTVFKNGSYFEARWSKLENNDETDPVLGYKVTVWEEELGTVYEMKEDGTMESVEVDKAPKDVFDFNLAFEMQNNGALVKAEDKNIPFGIFTGRVKVVYKVKPDGKIEPPPTDNLVLNLRTDPNKKGTEINVPADKTEVTYPGIKNKRLYEVAVQAYTAKNIGPFSKRVRVFL